MPVIVADKRRHIGVATPKSLGEEVVVVDIGGYMDDYIVEGYIDLSELQTDDSIYICEWIAVDGVRYAPYSCNIFGGVLSEPIIRFHTKTLLGNMKYRVSIKQVTGTPRRFPYGFLVEILGVV